MNTEKPVPPSDIVPPEDGYHDAMRDEAGPERQGGHHPDDVIAALRIELVRAREEAAAMKDRALRIQAEMDNIRKRTEREKADTAKYAITKFAQDIVNVADNFQRAIEAVPKDQIEQDGPVKAVLEGVVMIEREFLNALGRHGVSRIEALGRPFDPALQQAVMEIQDTAVPTGTVVQVFQPGYVIEGRVLRHAVVVVAKGGPKAAPVPQTGAAPDDPAAAPTSSEPEVDRATHDQSDVPSSEFGTDRPGGS